MKTASVGVLCWNIPKQNSGSAIRELKFIILMEVFMNNWHNHVHVHVNLSEK